MNRSRFLRSTLAIAALSLAGCIVAPPGRPRYVEPVMVAPPPPRVEYYTPPPMVGYVWISGAWHWRGGRYEWGPGYWAPPRHGQRWVPYRWERDGDRWQQHGGHWDRH
ncbi:MAG TPA: hypothetical protein PK225_13485 [Azonexus sp.]|jgi:hypothetical protein|nr:hypothetical protein [Azonexus sp.]